MSERSDSMLPLGLASPQPKNPSTAALQNSPSAPPAEHPNPSHTWLFLLSVFVFLAWAGYLIGYLMCKRRSQQARLARQAKAEMALSTVVDDNRASTALDADDAWALNDAALAAAEQEQR
eukprot:CAMPEP_0181207472 /NCGR_PEP_ID=MMETSP1096-20121128/21605_1 /TAXON_ID=156174 ORGANISM="Chrysochromulina ericina, Strain CCMP281" /NCGR_SAMPLE_ID=MMETSP1096 /ASSEMBLY_ACC=CAM_ASM_000453 /LENGTH=119 /DNA_ID=CAMNT_0023298477 /DNA_START=84 /DNA_END=443 /DNA_ORIENTATION=+